MREPFTPRETAESLIRGDAFCNQLSRAHAVALLERVAELEDALRPFAEIGQQFHGYQGSNPLLHDCLRAKEVLEKGKQLLETKCAST